MYQLGWVFNSEKHRQDIETIISLTQDQGTLDELGLGSVRDGFANLFFPGTTTIQTRAKYFLIVPWLLEEIYKKNEEFGSFSKVLRREEVKVIEELKKREEQDGLIGQSAGERLKRMPSSIYWTGLKKYGIVLPDLTLSQLPSYFRRRMRLENSSMTRRITKEDKLADLNEGKENVYLTSGDLPKYPGLSKLNLNLSFKEAEFLRKRILLKEGNSLLAYILKDIDENPDFLELNSFEDMADYLGDKCPLREALQAALLFDRIMKGAYIRYNYCLSLQASREIKQEWAEHWRTYLDSLSGLTFTENSFDQYFKQFYISQPTVQFCREWLRLINSDVINEKAIDGLLRLREVKLKGNERSRLQNTSLAQKTSMPIGIGISGNEIQYLNFRFFVAKRIITDIYNGLILK